MSCIGCVCVCVHVYIGAYVISKQVAEGGEYPESGQESQQRQD